MKKWFLLCSALLSFSLFADSVNFLSKPISAGKASLTENAYSVSNAAQIDFLPVGNMKKYGTI